jgi:Ca2+-binding RTX toxin-like protein
MAKFTGTAKNDTLTGGTGNDQLFGLAGNDSLTGGLGDDVLDGGLGADAMVGGQGNDRYFIDALGETIVEAANEGRDLVTVRNPAALTKAIDNVEDYIFTGTARVSFTGNARDNSIAGAAASDTLFGGAGADTVNGGAGADSLEGGDGNDLYVVDNAGDMAREQSADAAGGLDTVVSSVSYTLGFGIEKLQLTGSSGTAGTGNDLANAIVGNVGANKLQGLAGIDFLDGGGGNDTLDGGEGLDTMVGGAGNDTYFVDSLGDVVTEELSGVKGGIDTVVSSTAFVARDLKHVEHVTLVGESDVRAVGNELANKITGNDGDNNLTGGGGNDTLTGGAGSDQLFGSISDITPEGNDLLIGGSGDDVYHVSKGDKIVESLSGLAGGVDTVVFVSVTFAVVGDAKFTLGANLENLQFSSVGGGTATGNGLDNVISAEGNGNSSRLFGLAGADTLIGADQRSDLLDGGTGADIMRGGGSNDTYIVDDVNDIVVETDTGVGDEIRTRLGVMVSVANVENYVFLGAAVNFTGNELINQITGTKFNDTLNGGGGVGDNLFGGAGNDILIRGGDGDGTISGGTGADTMVGGAEFDFYSVDNAKDVVDELAAGDGGSDDVTATINYSLIANGVTLKGTIENLTLAGSGNISGTGNDFNNSIRGNSGANRLSGLAGNDSIFGSTGNDTINGGEGVDTLNGGSGNDRLDGGSDSDVLSGGFNGNDTLDGGDGNDKLGGGDGNDLLVGGAGDDGLSGDGGNDFINVSEGNDSVFILNKLDGHDVVQGFDGDAAGGQDILSLDVLLDSLGIADADRASHVQIVDKGSTIEVRIDTSVAGDGVFDYFAVTIQTADEITVGSDIIVV